MTQVEALHAYTVWDPVFDLKATLHFPSSLHATQLSYRYDLAVGTLYIGAEAALLSAHPRGSDTDWQAQEVTVYSRSDTALDDHYALCAGYIHPFAEGLQLGIGFTHEYWKLRWSGTQQYDYVTDSADYFPGSTVTFSQRLDGISGHLSWENRRSVFPWRLRFALDTFRHDSVDTHLLRGFYTKSSGLLSGFSAGGGITLLKTSAGSFSAGILYRKLSGGADMTFYHALGDNAYMTLPASFRTTLSRLSLEWNYPFGE